MIVHNKLIRDNIPQIIRACGKIPQTRNLSETEFLPALEKKLTEELNEYLASGEIEELVDLLEVIYAIAAAKGTSIEALEMLRCEKRNQRGGFSKQLFLKSVD